MKLRYIQGGVGLLFLTGAIVIGCGGSSDDGAGGKGGSDSSGGKGGGGGKGGNAGNSATGGKGGALGTGGAGGTGGGSVGTGGAGGGTGGTGGAGGGTGGTGGAAGSGGSTPDAGVDAAVDAPVVVVQDASTDTFEDAAPLAPGVLAYEPFGAVGRLSGAATGAGWGGSWSVNSDDINVAGYQVVNAMPLSYMNLRSTPSYAIGGQSYRESGRALDVSAEGAFKDFLAAPARIGAAGKSLWVSFLMRRDATDDTTTKVSFHSSNSSFWDGDPNAPATFAFGFFGDGSKTDGTRYWTVRAREGDAPVKTNVAITPGQTVFVVMNVAFTDTAGTVTLYLNPASLGTDAPATPSAQLTATMPLTFKAMMFYPGNGAASAAIDEIRFGTSYAAVTPIN